MVMNHKETLEELEERYKVLTKSKESISIVKLEKGLDFTPFPKQKEFIELTNKAQIIYWMGAHQTGKTTLAKQIVRAWATGYYPEDWEGKRFDRPTKGIIIGHSAMSVNSLLKTSLLGNHFTNVSGIIPLNSQKKLNKQGSLFDTKMGRSLIKYQGSETVYSSLLFRTFLQGNMGIEGETDVDWIWIDEMPKLSFLAVASNRTICVKDSVIIMTATPEKDYISDTVKMFLFHKKEDLDAPKEMKRPNIVYDNIVYINSSWSDHPNITEENKVKMRKLYLPHQLEVAEHGLPKLGASNVFQFNRSSYVTSPFVIPNYYTRINGMDVGINDPTAIVYGAIDTDTKVIHIINEYKKNNMMPSQHHAKIQSLNLNHENTNLKQDIRKPHIIDMSSNNRSIGETIPDMETVLKAYQKLGWNVLPAKRMLRERKNSTIQKIYQLIDEKKLVIFDNCINLIDEIENYRRDEEHRIIDGQDDHLIDALLYLIEHVTENFITYPVSNKSTYY